MVFTQHFHISSIPSATSKAQVWDPPARMSSAGPMATGRASARRERPPKPSWPSWNQDFATWRWENLWKSMNIYENLWTSMNIYEHLWKSMKMWYFYIVTPVKSSSFDNGFPTENRYFTCCSPFSDTPNWKIWKGTRIRGQTWHGSNQQHFGSTCSKQTAGDSTKM